MKSCFQSLLILLLFISSCTNSFKSPNRELASRLKLDKSGYSYDPKDKSCDGFPKLDVETAPGTCLGLVLSRKKANDEKTDRSFIKPRTIVQIPNTEEFLVIDMGGWKANNGRLFWLKKDRKGEYGIHFTKFEKMLDTPHGLRVGPDGKIYVGEKGRIIRFDFVEGRPENIEVVVADLPAFEGHMHPLTQFVIDPKTYDLFINSGAPSDHCFVSGDGEYKTCPEEFSDGLGAIYRIPGKFIKDLPQGGVKFYEVTASGLRNSMAMAIHPSGKLLQGENGRDFPEFEEPYEEINVIDLADDKRGRHYGWPYCYNFNATSPEWLFEENSNSPMLKKFKKPVDCNLDGSSPEHSYQPPFILLPPHVAPLDMLYYNGRMFPEYRGHLLMSWHGHQPTGNRIVAYPTDEGGLPILDTNFDQTTFKIDSDKGCPKTVKFTPRGGLTRSAQYTELISGWDKKDKVRPEGSPVGMFSFSLNILGSLQINVEMKGRRLSAITGLPSKNFKV